MRNHTALDHYINIRILKYIIGDLNYSTCICMYLPQSQPNIKKHPTQSIENHLPRDGKIGEGAPWIARETQGGAITKSLSAPTWTSQIAMGTYKIGIKFNILFWVVPLPSYSSKWRFRFGVSEPRNIMNHILVVTSQHPAKAESRPNYIIDSLQILRRTWRGSFPSSVSPFPTGPSIFWFQPFLESNQNLRLWGFLRLRGFFQYRHLLLILYNNSIKIFIPTISTMIHHLEILESCLFRINIETWEVGLPSVPQSGRSTTINGDANRQTKKEIFTSWILMMFKMPSVGHLARCSTMTVREYDLWM